MNYLKYDIVFQEIPNEIALVFYFTGCPLKCKGCHSPELWNKNNGQLFTVKLLDDLLSNYSDLISCVLCMGGEWDPHFLVELFKVSKGFKLKTALYTGRELQDLSCEILNNLDYLKTGPWVEELGGLNSKDTNQKFYEFL